MKTPALFLLPLLSLLPAVAIAAPLDDARELIRERKFAEARKLLEPLVAADAKAAAPRYHLGICLMGLGDAEAAAEVLEQAVALDPTKGAYHRSLGDACGMTAQKAGLLSKMGWARRCGAAYQKAVEVDPSDVRSRWSLMEFCRQAPGLVGGGIDKAYVQAAEIRKLDAERGRVAYANLYATEKKFAEAFGLFDEVLKANPTDYAANFHIGRLASQSGTRPDAGLAALRACLAQTPPNGQAPHAVVHFLVGSLLEKKGDVAGAKGAYQQALALDPSHRGAADGVRRLAR